MKPGCGWCSELGRWCAMHHPFESRPLVLTRRAERRVRRAINRAARRFARDGMGASRFRGPQHDWCSARHAREGLRQRIEIGDRAGLVDFLDVWGRGGDR